PSHVILFGDIPTVIPSTSVIAPETSANALVVSSAAPVVEMTIVASPTGLRGLILIHLRLLILLRHHHRRTLMLLPFLVRGARHVSPRSSDHRLSSSSSPMNSLLVHSSGLDAPGQAHSGSSTRVVSPRLGYPPVRAPRHSEAFFHWCDAPLSTFYPLTTSESSSRDLDLTRANLLPPRKRFRGSYLSETSMEENTEIDTTSTEDGKELDIVDEDDVRDHIEVDPRDDREEFEASARDTVMLGIDPRLVPMVDGEIVEPVGGDSSSTSGTRDGTIRSIEDIPVDLDGAIHDFYHHMSERASMAESIRSLRSENLKIRDDRNDLRRKLRRLESFTERHLGFSP
nr:hypothetical protein [Tanacetum cinerariifolium]